MAFNLDRVTTESQEKGAWGKMDGSEFLIASAKTFAYQNEITRLSRPFKKKMDKGTVPAKDMFDILCTAMSKHILLDWKNVEDGKGKQVPYSQELAYKYLMSNSELYDFVTSYSEDVTNFYTTMEEEEGEL